jgi:hypothetical protein
MKRLIAFIIASVAISLPSAAQGGDGQFCVRSFEDRNANQTRDQGEVLLTSGVGADLIDETGVVVASALLADSPTAAQGIICFQFLPPGQYTIQVTSAEYQATTPATMTVTLVGGELPAVLEFGAQSVAALVATGPETLPATGPDWQRIGTAAIGAIVAVLVMQVLGLLIYALVLRGRNKEVVADVKPDTGQFKRPVG